MSEEDKKDIDRLVYESAYERMHQYGLASILTSPSLIKNRAIIKNKIISYYESTEEFEKCNFLVGFFDSLEKEILLPNIIKSLKNNSTNKEAN